MKVPYSTFVQVQPTWFLPIIPVGYNPRQAERHRSVQDHELLAPADGLRAQPELLARAPSRTSTRSSSIEYADITAQVNALLGGQVETISLLTSDEIPSLESQGKKVVISPGGGMNPFTMNTQVAPFDDVRVRQAMRLLVDRKQMLDLVFKGNGTIGNDVISRWDPAYDTSHPAARAGHRAGQVAAQGRPGRRASRSSSSRPTSPWAWSTRAQVFAQQAQGRRRHRQPAQDHGDRLLRARVPQVPVRLRLLGLPVLPAAGRLGAAAELAVSTRRTGTTRGRRSSTRRRWRRPTRPSAPRSATRCRRSTTRRAD